MEQYTWKDFVHLHGHSEYSILDSTGYIKSIVAKAKELGMKALALTDHGNMYGALKFYRECKKAGIKPILGCEVYTTNNALNASQKEKTKDNHHLILLAENEQGYKNLVKIVSEGTRDVYNKRPRVHKETLRAYHEGIICLSACLAGELPRAIREKDEQKVRRVIEEHIDIFGKENYFLEIQRHGIDDEDKVAYTLKCLAKEYDLEIVATNDFHYVNKEDWIAQDILYCIQYAAKYKSEERLKLPTPEFYLKSAEEMNALFDDEMNCLSNTAKIADRCNVDLKMGHLLTPKFPNVPDGMTEASYLRQLCNEAFHKKYPSDYPKLEEAKKRLEFELSVIEQMEYSGYFLIVWDFIKYARKNNISIGPGRGSGAGSIVCFLTGITELDPLEYGLLFERFLNPERVSMPDIDTDISDIGRSKIVEYMIKTYQFDKSAQIVTFGFEKSRSAVRDVARVMEYPLAKGDEIAKLIPNDPHMTIPYALENVAEFRNKYDSDPIAKLIIDDAMKIEGAIRNIGTHAAGVVISEYPLVDYLPVEEKEDGLHTEFDKNEVEDIGLLKMDLLGLKNLSIIDGTKALVRKHYGIDIDFDKIPKDDKKAMDMLKRGDTLGVFQLESSGMTELVVKLAPEEFKDLIPLVALYRPGPLGSGMVDDFIKCRHGEKEIEYIHPCLEPILKETFGVILYQEQVMKIVQVMAGFSLGKADLVRRAMGKKKEDILIAQKNDFIEGCVQNGIDDGIAARVFELMMYFASYGFNKSHSAAYAYLAYQTAYLKANYPLEYMASYVSNNLGKPEKIARTINIVKDFGFEILPVDVTKSYGYFIPEDGKLRFGMNAIPSIGDSIVPDLVREREKRPFESVEDFLMRVKVSREQFNKLCKLGAFKSLLDNYNLLVQFSDQIYTIVNDHKKMIEKSEKKNEKDASLNLFDDDVMKELEIKCPTMEEMVGKNPAVIEIGESDKLRYEKEILNFYFTANPLDYCKETLERCSHIQEILDEPEKFYRKRINLCVIPEDVRRIVTKKGDPMAFLKITEYQASIDAVLFPEPFIEALAKGFLDMDVLLLSGFVEERNGEPQLIVKTVKGKNI